MTRFFFTPKRSWFCCYEYDQHMVGQLFPTTHSKSSLSSSFDLTQRQKREDLACFTGAHKWPYPNFVPRHIKREPKSRFLSDYFSFPKLCIQDCSIEGSLCTRLYRIHESCKMHCAKNSTVHVCIPKCNQVLQARYNLGEGPSSKGNELNLLPPP